MSEEEKSPEQTPASEPNTEEKLKSEILYMRAEFENTKRRLLRDQETSIRFANERLVGDLLGIVDLFERGLGSSTKLKDKGEDVASFVTGIEMTHKELVTCLQRYGAELIGVAGEKFDPNRHEAISQAPASGDQVDTVIAVVQRGCLFNGRLLKPAKVVVGVAQEN